MRTAILLTIPYVILSSAGLVLIKSALNKYSPEDWTGTMTFVSSNPFLLGALFYAGGYALYIAALRFADLTAIFPIATGLFFITIAGFGVFILDEALTWNRISGMALIAVGIWFTSSS